MEMTTLGALQNVLPIGYAQNGKVHRQFKLHDWFMKQEDQIADLHQKHQNDDTVGVQVADVLSIILASIGDIPVANGKREYEENRLLLGQMYLQDIMYIYLYLRSVAVDQYIGVALTCPFCNKKHEHARGDLSTMEVERYTPKDTYPPTDTIKLSKGLTIGGKTFKKIHIGPARWTAIESLSADEMNNAAMFQRATWRGSITSVEGHDTKGGPFVPDDAMFETLRKTDMMKLAVAIDNINAGPDMSINMECTRCHKEFDHLVNWAYRDFFGKSSLYVSD